MSPERLAHLKQNAPNYDDYDARVDVAELVAELEGAHETISYLSGEVTSAREELLSVRDFADKARARFDEASADARKAEAEVERLTDQLDRVLAGVYVLAPLHVIEHVKRVLDE